MINTILHKDIIESQKMIVIFLKITAIILMLTGCTSSSDKGEVLPFTTIGKFILGGSEGISKQDIIINTQGKWENLKSAMGVQVTNSFNETEIDFDKYQVLAVFDEVRNTGGWEIVITKITGYKENLSVNVKVNKKSCVAVPLEMTQPYHIVKTHQILKTIEFKYVNN